MDTLYTRIYAGCCGIFCRCVSCSHTWCGGRVGAQKSAAPEQHRTSYLQLFLSPFGARVCGPGARPDLPARPHAPGRQRKIWTHTNIRMYMLRVPDLRPGQSACGRNRPPWPPAAPTQGTSIARAPSTARVPTAHTRPRTRDAAPHPFFQIPLARTRVNDAAHPRAARAHAPGLEVTVRPPDICGVYRQNVLCGTARETLHDAQACTHICTHSLTH